jgi:hypothetical protein
MKRFSTLLLLWVLVAGCGRYFGGPIQPVPETEQEVHMVVQDDGSVTYVYERLEIGLRPMSDAELNRQFPAHSNDGAASTNPFTYGDWKPMGENWTPPKYTVFLLRVKNYAYPKILVDPGKAELISSTSRRSYAALYIEEILEYYYAHALGYAGNYYRRFQERKDLLRRTLYQADPLFSGQDEEGFVVFPRLDPDVKEFEVHLRDIALRFDYRGEPVENIDLTFRFQREVFKGYQPPASLTAER